MTRPIRICLGLLCCLSAPSLAFAQDDDDELDLANNTGGLSVTLQNADGVDFNPLDPQEVFGRQACERNATLTFRIRGLATGFNTSRYLEFWIGESCANSNARDGEENDDCQRIGDVERTGTRDYEDVEISMDALCLENSQGQVEIYFLPVDTTNTSESIDVYGMFRINIDIDPPTTPSGLSGGSGETEIPIEWSSGGANISRHFLIWDRRPIDVSELDGGAEAAGDLECVSASLLPGEEIDFDNLGPSIKVKTIEGAGVRATVSGDELGAQQVAMAVVAEDLAGNVSKLSNIACVKVVPTDGFWDEVAAQGGDYESGCACSVPGARTNPLAALPVVVALAFLRIRRKRRS